MEKVIDYIQDLELELTWLSGLCDVLRCVDGSNAELANESVGGSFLVLREVLSAKVAEIDKVVIEYYAARAGELASKP